MALTQVTSGLIVGVANTQITGNIVSSQITSVNSTQVTGTLTVSQGGTGATTLSSGALLKGAGTGAITTATAGTDFVAPGTSTTFTALQTFAGSTSNFAIAIQDAAENINVSATAAGANATIHFDLTSQGVLYYTTNASANWTLNIRGNSTTAANTLMTTGQAVTVAFLTTQGTTAYYPTALTVDGTSVTPKYQGGFAWTSGNASGIDVYTYTIIKTGSNAFTALASQTQFK